MVLRVPEPARTACWRGEVARGGRPFARAVRWSRAAQPRVPGCGGRPWATMSQLGCSRMAPYQQLPLQPPRCHRRARRRPEERGRGRPVVGTTETLRAAAAPALRRLALTRQAGGIALGHRCSPHLG